jgi:hypothetical protein
MGTSHRPHFFIVVGVVNTMESILTLIGALLLEHGDELAAVTILAGLICWWISTHKDNTNGRDME